MKFPTHIGSAVNLTMLQYGKRLRPVRDWFIVLTVLAVLLIGSVAWNVLFFLGALEEDAAPATTSHEPSAAAPVAEVLSAFTLRAQEEARYRSEYRFVDPSR